MKRFLNGAALLACGALLAACGSVGPERSDGATARVRSSAATAAAANAKGDPQQRFTEALQLMRDGQRNEAQAALLALSNDFPQFSGPLTDLGILYAQSKQRELAIASFKKAVVANPRNAVAYNWLGVLYRETGNFAAAEQAYKQAIAAKPDAPAAYLNLAILYDISLHRSQDALVNYRNYQKYANGQDSPMVAVWIKELELRGSGGGGAVAVGAAQK